MTWLREFLGFKTLTKRQKNWKKWIKKHREERRVYQREWYQRNKCRINGLQRDYKRTRYGANPEFREKIKARNKNWWRENRAINKET